MLRHSMFREFSLSHRIAVVCFAAAVITLAILTGAFAAVPSTVVDFGPVVAETLSWAAPIIVVLFAALGVFVLFKLLGLVGLKANAMQRAVIEQGFERAIGYAMSKVGEMAARGIPVDVKNETIAIAAGYVAKSVPGALKHFGKKPEDIAGMVEARLNQAFPSTIVTPLPGLAAS